MEKKIRCVYLNSSECNLSKDTQEEIFDLFPTNLPQDQDSREELCDEKINELRKALAKYKDNQDFYKQVSRKLKVMIYQSPYLHIIEKYKQVQKDINLCDDQEPLPSSFHSEKHTPALLNILNCIDKKEPITGLGLDVTLKHEELQILLEDIHNFYYGRIPNLEKVLLLFPDFLKKFYDMQICLLLEEGSLPLDWRFFLAIMAVSCLGNDYYFGILINLFLNIGGEEKWINEGLSAVPKKLQKIAELNNCLAFRPWQLSESCILKDLLRCGGDEQWSVGEVIHAIMIFSFYHSWSSFAYGNGVKKEVDMSSSMSDKRRTPREKNGRDKGRDSEKYKKDNLKPETAFKNDIIRDILKKLEEGKEEINFGVNDDMKKSQSTCENNEINPIEPPYNRDPYRKFINKIESEPYQDYDYHKYKVMHSHEFNWKTHAFAIINEYFPKITNLINEKFEFVLKMSKNTFGDAPEKVNTQPFIRALWKYIENIFGVVHLDYEYKIVNQLLPWEFKLYVKTMVTKPYELNKSNSSAQRTRIKFLPSEKCHITLLTSEARFQIGLVYGLEAIQKYI